jgi:hypothetical protein
MLARLAERGLLEATWERTPPEGRPPRHLYRLTAVGADLAMGLAPEPVIRKGGGWAAVGTGRA